MEESQLPKDIKPTVARAIAEDVGEGDVTAALVAEDATATAYVIAKEPCIVCGKPWFNEVFAQLDPRVKVQWDVMEGAAARAEQRVCVVTGPSRSLLTGERTALNFLQLLTGTATMTRKFMDRLRGTTVKIVDTRKTLPGLRAAQKYAVRLGGGTNHRFGLYDAILIKENHIAAAGSLAKAIELARGLHPKLPLMAEAENLDEVKAGLDGKVDVLLLDDFPTHLLSKAVAMARDYRKFNKAHSLLEASGGVTLQNVRDIADTGVDRISVGSLTKNVQASDLSMRFVNAAATKPAATKPAQAR
ncbi:MAG TPA: carboxylating nicotinate-nucleotide diphosphorylase [Nevskiaceae bacterium]|nr:carboxylating nicotinate-nucleotide diphosphorylase [Nevskiaceae bacterium]